MRYRVFFVVTIFLFLIYIGWGKFQEGKRFESLNSYSDSLNSINVYFNSGADTTVAYKANKANFRVNLEDRLINRLNCAYKSIDVAIYEINLPRVVNTLIKKASDSILVRLIVDGKIPKESAHKNRYKIMSLYLEKMARGKDKIIGTYDDVHIFSDRPISIVKDEKFRSKFGLPKDYSDIKNRDIYIGKKNYKDRFISLGEIKKSPNYFYSGSEQMHNKFVIIDNEWVWTGSWNFTVTGLYGSKNNMKYNKLNGNIQNSIEIRNYDLADEFTKEFNEMWGSDSAFPNIYKAKFHSRKVDNTEHTFNIGNRKVLLFFSPGDNLFTHINRLIEDEADSSIYFEIFAWSRQDLVDIIKKKWENSAICDNGTKTGFEVKGVFENMFYNMWWSASVDMLGKVAKESKDNKNNRWRNKPEIFADQYVQKLHSKFMLVDNNTSSNPFVITGSANWSKSSEMKNDENVLVIFDMSIVNQYYQSFVYEYFNSKK